MSQSTWDTIELVILRAIRAAEETNADPDAAARAAVPDLSDNMYRETINALATGGYLDANVTSMGSGGLMVHVRRLLPKGRRAIGQWPRPPSGTVDDKRTRRLLFMDALYDAAEDNTLQPVSVDEIAARFGWDAGEAQRVVTYLENEGLLRFEMGNQATITHRGIVEVEESRSLPHTPTQHFPPSTLVYVAGDMTNSQLVAGASGAVKIAVNDTASVGAIQSFLDEFRRALPDLPREIGDRAAVEANLDAAETILHSPQPNRPALTALLNSLRDVALSATGSAAFAGVVRAAERLS